MNQETDPGYHEQHDTGEGIDEEGRISHEITGLDPGKNNHVDASRIRRLPGQLQEGQDRNHERAEDGKGADSTDDRFVLDLLAE